MIGGTLLVDIFVNFVIMTLSTIMHSGCTLYLSRSKIVLTTYFDSKRTAYS